jgi:ABC-type polysaccharide/polyol phosphate export permease
MNQHAYSKEKTDLRLTEYVLASLQNQAIYSSLDESTLPKEEIVLSKVNLIKRDILSPERILKSIPFVANAVSENFLKSFTEDSKQKQKIVKKKKGYFDKTKGRRALFYVILSVSCIVIAFCMFALFLIGPYLNDSSEFIINTVTFTAVIIALLGFIFFPILVIINLVKAFKKPKDTELPS